MCHTTTIEGILSSAEVEFGCGEACLDYEQDNEFLRAITDFKGNNSFEFKVNGEYVELTEKQENLIYITLLELYEEHIEDEDLYSQPEFEMSQQEIFNTFY